MLAATCELKSGFSPSRMGTTFFPNELSSPFGPSSTTSFALPPGRSLQCAGSVGFENFMWSRLSAWRNVSTASRGKST
ncbi:MAG: hypothetical protein IT374_25515 [Polyangiaceae bacterium]|nr:hypothetical protein [Polyangiaceae bacterium]